MTKIPLLAIFCTSGWLRTASVQSPEHNQHNLEKIQVSGILIKDPAWILEREMWWVLASLLQHRMSPPTASLVQVANLQRIWRKKAGKQNGAPLPVLLSVDQLGSLTWELDEDLSFPLFYLHQIVKHKLTPTESRQGIVASKYNCFRYLWGVVSEKKRYLAPNQNGHKKTLGNFLHKQMTSPVAVSGGSGLIPKYCHLFAETHNCSS